MSRSLFLDLLLSLVASPFIIPLRDPDLESLSLELEKSLDRFRLSFLGSGKPSKRETKEKKSGQRTIVDSLEFDSYRSS